MSDFKVVIMYSGRSIWNAVTIQDMSINLSSIQACNYFYFDGTKWTYADDREETDSGYIEPLSSQTGFTGYLGLQQILDNVEFPADTT